MSMRFSVTRRYAFEAGHFLPMVADDHKCKRPHGHNYELDVTVSAPLHDNGFIIDFWDLDKIVDPLIEKLDHRMLNGIEGLENPTAEHIAAWFLLRIPMATAIRVFETKNCWADAIRT